MEKTKIKNIFFSTFPPYECGIATYSKKLIDSLEDLYVRNQIKVCAVSDRTGRYAYHPRVIMEINKFDRKSYATAAEFINSSPYEVVSLQHEYGIYGGRDGRYVLDFLENCNKPVVTTLHSVLTEHDTHRYKLTQRILDLSRAIVVMTRNSKRILTDNFNVDAGKIHIINHGVPNIRFDEKSSAKELLGYKDKIVLGTFGLINRGKGIEITLKALAKVVKDHPNIIYLIIGVTHPVIRKREGESYRHSLIELIKEYKLEDNIVFINRYLEYDELIDYLKGIDIYVAPQLDLHQAVSGAISYAIGCDCAVITTPTSFAKEVLASNRGIIIESDPDQFAQVINRLIESPELLNKMQLKAYRYARERIWPSVGIEYLRVIELQLYEENGYQWRNRLPDLNEPPSLDYLEKMTDDFALIQHARFDMPDERFGYSLDDQARAIISCVKYINVFGRKKDYINSTIRAKELLKKYLNYLHYAIDDEGKIHNFINIKRQIADDVASLNSIGRSFWALSYLIKTKKIPTNIKKDALKLLDVYKSSANYFDPCSAMYILLAYSLLNDNDNIIKLADYLVDQFNKNSKDGEWKWFDDCMTWGSPMMTYALIKAYRTVGNENYKKVALQSLTFLENAYNDEGIPSPVGNEWYCRGKSKSKYDQQPIEAADMVILYNELYDLMGEQIYFDKAVDWFGWYFGNNINNEMVYNTASHGVYDALTKDGVNKNCGAESIVTYLMAYLSFDGGL